MLEVVLIDISEDKLNIFLLEDFARSIPILVADALLSDTLKDAGIEKKNVRGLSFPFFFRRLKFGEIWEFKPKFYLNSQIWLERGWVTWLQGALPNWRFELFSQTSPLGWEITPDF